MKFSVAWCLFVPPKDGQCLECSLEIDLERGQKDTNLNQRFSVQ